VIPVYGPIFPRANLFTEISGATSIDMLTAAFREARADKDVAAIVLDIDSPGGAVTGVSEFAAMVRASTKPVIAYASGMMASAAYWIGSAAHSIAVADTSWVGSIGVASMYYVDDDDGVIEVVSTQSPLKRPDIRSDEGRAIAQRHVDELADVFISAVATYRGVTSEFVTANFGRGDVLIGGAAQRMGMVDAVATFENLVREMRNEYTVTPVAKALPPLAQLVATHGYNRAAAVYASVAK
jgi:ClpP class serine protease